ncbi:amidase [Salinirubellus sp. GCM10025818]|uniref:amidase n=1 Tax=Salinirubellus TaxID=2162630 RepID=UPI0030CD08D4
MVDSRFTSAGQLAEQIRDGERAPTDVIDECLERIEDRNARTNAFVTIAAEDAREAAQDAERAVEDGEELGPLHGVPIAVKDLNETAGIRTTFGSPLFADNVPDADDILVKRMKEAGAIVVGKTNTPEFGHKGTTDNPVFGATGTPYDPTRTAGGSSGGSAAAVADGLVPIAQGSDGGGSIRIPASCCNVVGLKPSFGRVPSDSRPDGFGHTPFGQAGPLARTVEDAALLCSVLAGPSGTDPFSLPEDGTDFLGAVDVPVDDVKVAYSPDLGVFPLEDRVRDVVDDAVDDLSSVVATVDRVDPEFEHDRETMLESWMTGYRVGMAERASVLAEHGRDPFDRREELTPEVIEGMEAGMGYSAVEYKRSDIVRTDVFDAVQVVFDEYDMLLTATVALPPFDTEMLGPDEVAGESVHPLYGWFLTWPFNMTDHPAASVPAGFADGLPVGLQLVGPRFDDERVISIAAALERVRPWADRSPPE